MRWAVKMGHCPLPASPESVADYLTERFEEKEHMPTTLRVAASAIRYVHAENDLADPCASREVVEVLRGASRKSRKRPKQARALMSAEFVRIQANACVPRRGRGGGMESRETAEKRGKFDIALIGLMRDCLLRRVEAAEAEWGDITDYGDGTGRLHIRRSKTDQEGNGAVGFISESTMVMLRQLKELKVRVAPGDRIFGLGEKALYERIRQAALEAGLGEGFSGHSPSVGMARDLARAGTELPSLMQVGRWKSPTMPAAYIREEEAGRNAVAKYYGHSL